MPTKKKESRKWKWFSVSPTTRLGRDSNVNSCVTFERRSNEQSFNLGARYLSPIPRRKSQKPGLSNLSLLTFLGGDCLCPAVVFSASALRSRNFLWQFPGLFPGADGPRNKCSAGQSRRSPGYL